MDLYFIVGYNNVSAWRDNELDEVDLDKVFHKQFSTVAEKDAFVQGLFLLDMNIHLSRDNYTIIDEDEYRLLTT